MSKAKPPVAMSLWLLPCAREVNDWQQVIDSLAAEHTAPPFAAHVTAATIDVRHLETRHRISHALRWLEIVASSFGPLTLTVSPPSTGNSFFQCVLCELPTTPVANIGQAFLALADRNHERNRSHNGLTRAAHHAHISLLYGSMAPEQRIKIAGTVVSPARSLTLDTLMLTGPGEGQSDFSAPEAWETLGTARLTGEPVSALSPAVKPLSG